jgi:hypothetical protein
MTRRELIALLGTTAVSWPVGASAQQAERVRRVGVLMPTTEDDTEGRARVAGFMNGLRDVARGRYFSYGTDHEAVRQHVIVPGLKSCKNASRGLKCVEWFVQAERARNHVGRFQPVRASPRLT